MESDVNQIFNRLLERADTHGILRVSADEVTLWPDGMLDQLLGMGLLVCTDNALGLVCDGCEEGCWVVPEPQCNSDGGEILTHMCTEREDIGIVEFSSDRLLAWRLNMEGVAAALSGALSISCRPVVIESGRLWFLGKVRIRDKQRTFYFGWGYGLDDAERIAGVMDERMTTSNPILLVPHRLPDKNMWPDPLGRIIALTNVTDLSSDKLDLDIEAVCGRRGQGHKKGHIRKFPMPPGVTSWDPVFIRVMNDVEVELQVGRRSEVRNFVEMGMADSRHTPPEPDSTWNLLLHLAENDGELHWGDKGASANARTYMKTLRSRLREIFCLEDDPIEDYKKKRCWKTIFNLVDPRRQSSPISVKYHEGE